MAGDRLSRRDVLGGLMSAAAVGAAVRGTALASPAAGETPAQRGRAAAGQQRERHRPRAGGAGRVPRRRG